MDDLRESVGPQHIQCFENEDLGEPRECGVNSDEVEREESSSEVSFVGEFPSPKIWVAEREITRIPLGQRVPPTEPAQVPATFDNLGRRLDFQD